MLACIGRSSLVGVRALAPRSKTEAMAVVCWAWWCSPFFSRSGFVAGEVVELFRRCFFSFFAPLGGRGGEGRSRWRRVLRFWCWWCWASSPSASLLRPAMVARGVAHGEDGSRWLAWALFPSAGCWVVRWRRCWDRIRSSSQVAVAQRRPGFAVIIDMKRRFLFGGVRYGDGGVG